MNHIYRVVYNHHTNTYQAVPEISNGAHTSCSNSGSTLSLLTRSDVLFSRAVLSTLALAVTALGTQRAHAAPTGGQVSAGQATIQQNGKVTDIHQTSQKAAINWQKFGIKADETVNFKQPNAQSVTLNRVIGNEKSVIDGAMKANGKVFITNPNGVMIGNGAKINVGALLATTGKISDNDFMAGNYRFQDAKGAVENYGEITVPEGGAVALIAPVVRNQGTIKAPQGNALLASAEQFSVTLQDDSFAYTLDKGTLQGLVDNGGAIYADAGHIVLTAKGVDMVKKSLIKHSGIAEANTVRSKNGVIELLGDLDNTRLEVSGSLKAEAKENSDGGFIETSASQLDISEQANISTHAENGKTGTWLIDPKDFTVAPSGGDTTGAVVSKGLEQNNVTLKSRDGAKEGKGDVVINDEISWNKNTLTLNAENDIHINKNLTGTETAKLALQYGQGTADGTYQAIVDGEQTTQHNDYHLQKDTPLKDRTVKINLPEGQTFSTQKGSQGATNEFTVIHKMPEISKNAEGDWVSQFTVKNIALGADIDVSHTRNYEGFAGWDTPVNSYGQSIGIIHGLGHVVDGLWLRSKKDNQETGLFTQNSYYGEIRDIGVTNVDISSEGKWVYTGGLAGAGYNISNSYATGNVSTSGGGASAGGLAGAGDNISNSYATGNVSTSGGGGAHAGGLAGAGDNISNSYATGNVSTSGWYADAGGLVGLGAGISNSYATGNVSTSGGDADAGGLVGSGGNISNSYATGNVSTSGGDADAGGLVGRGGNISNSYATGNVSTSGADADAGGLVGSGYKITNSYATGNVSTSGDKADAGGLVGFGYKITNSYANNPLVSASGQGAKIGGLISSFDNDSDHYLTNNFYNQDKQPTLQAVGSIENTSSKPANITNTVGKSDAELKQKSTFAGWDFDKVWRIQEGSDYPRLRALTEAKIVINPTTPVNPTNIGIKANDLNKVYDGKEIKDQSDLEQLNGWNGTGVTVLDKDGETVNIDLNDSNIFTGKLRFDGEGSNWQNARNAGKYTIVPTGLSGGQKYEIEYGNGILTIDKKPIAIHGSRVYDGTTDAVQGTALNVLNSNTFTDKLFKEDADRLSAVGNFSVALTGKGKLASKDVASNVTLTDKGSLQLSGLTDKAKEIIKNYDIDVANSRWTINKRPLIIQAMNNIKPAGENNPDVSRIGVTATGLVKGETISKVDLLYSDNNTDPNAQGYITAIRIGDVKFREGASGNYEIVKKHGKLLVLPNQYKLNEKFNLENNTEVLKIHNILNSVEDEIMLASAIYRDNNGKIHEVYAVFDKDSKHLEPISKILVPEGDIPQANENFRYEKLYDIVENSRVERQKGEIANGLGMAVYKKTGLDKYYIVFRGTDSGMGVINPLDPKGDGKANTGQGAGFLPEQYQEASRLVQEWLSKLKDKDVSIVGHSLGGGLATYSSTQNGKNPTVTFNPAALSFHNLPDNLKKERAELINKYRSQSIFQPQDLSRNVAAIKSANDDIEKKTQKIFKNINNFIFDYEVNQATNKLPNSLYVGNVHNVDLLSNKSIAKPIEDHSMNHIIKTQRLANVIVDNNAIIKECSADVCVKLRDNIYTPSNPVKYKSIDIKFGRELIFEHDRKSKILEMMYYKDKGINKPVILLDNGKPIAKVTNSDSVSIEQIIDSKSYFSTQKEWNINTGDIIHSNNKKAIIRFSDGSWIELAPNSSVKYDESIEKFGTDNTFIADKFSLVKGQILTKGNQDGKGIVSSYDRFPALITRKNPNTKEYSSMSFSGLGSLKSFHLLDGDILTSSSSLITDFKIGNDITFSDGSTLKLKPNTKVQVDYSNYDITKPLASAIKVLEGELVVNSKNEYIVNTQKKQKPVVEYDEYIQIHHGGESKYVNKKEWEEYKREYGLPDD